MEWLAFGLICWVAVRFLSVRRRGALSGRWANRHIPSARRAEAPLPQAPVAEPETAEQRLRRQYVEGTLTVEQYERELDRLYRPGA